MLRRLLLVAVAVLAVVVSACGSSSSNSSSTSTSASGSTQSSSSGKLPNLDYVQKRISQYMQMPKFQSPGPAFDASKAKGKVMLNVPLSSAIPFVNTIDKEMARISKQLGITFINCANQGRVSQWAACTGQAQNRNADIVNLDNAPNPAVLEPQIAAAKRAGIPTIATHIYDVLPEPKRAPDLAAIVPGGFTTAARLDADWAILKTKGKAHMLVVIAADTLPHIQMADAVKDEAARYCGSGCKVSVLNIPLAQWANRMQSDVSSALLKDPSINYVIPVVDGMTQYVVPAVTGAGRTGQVHVATFNGTPFAMKFLQNNQVIDMEVGENLNWNAWADMDQVMRVLAGVKPVENENTALRVFTSENIKEAGTPPQVNTGYGNAYVEGYSKLWKGVHVR